MVSDMTTATSRLHVFVTKQLVKQVRRKRDNVAFSLFLVRGKSDGRKWQLLSQLCGFIIMHLDVPGPWQGLTPPRFHMNSFYKRDDESGPVRANLIKASWPSGTKVNWCTRTLHNASQNGSFLTPTHFFHSSNAMPFLKPFINLSVLLLLCFMAR